MGRGGGGEQLQSHRHPVLNSDNYLKAIIRLLLVDDGIIYGNVSGTPGGPGTVFYTQTGSPGIGKLIIDNFAKNPYINKPSSTSEEFDVLTQGKIFMPMAT